MPLKKKTPENTLVKGRNPSTSSLRRLRDLFKSAPSSNASAKSSGSSTHTTHTPSPMSSASSIKTECTVPSPAASSVGIAVMKPKINQRELPEPVMENILQKLRFLHESGPRTTCTTCLNRDFVTMNSLNRKWHNVAAKYLYTIVYIESATCYHAAQKKLKEKDAQRRSSLATLLYQKDKQQERVRTVPELLRYTLRKRRDLAEYVVELRLPELDLEAFGNPNMNLAQAVIKWNNVMASIVMECPNLQRFVGPYQRTSAEHSRLNHALSTRKSLEQQVWLLEPPAQTAAGPLEPNSTANVPAKLDPNIAETFIVWHSNWQWLNTLIVDCNGLPGCISHDAFAGVFECLTRLRRLWLSKIDAEEFDDKTLQLLPRSLTHLRIEKCLGVTDSGWWQYSGKVSVQNIRILHIGDQDIKSLQLLARLLSTLGLQKFTFVQNNSPSPVPQGADDTPPPEIDGRASSPQAEDYYSGSSGNGTPLVPILSSKTIRALHWDILYPDLLDKHLANCIAAEHWPALRIMRTPCDRTGIFQSICLPREAIAFTTDKHQAKWPALRPLEVGSDSFDSQTATPGTNSPVPSGRESAMSHNSQRTTMSSIELPSIESIRGSTVSSERLSPDIHGSSAVKNFFTRPSRPTRTRSDEAKGKQRAVTTPVMRPQETLLVAPVVSSLAVHGPAGSNKSILKTAAGPTSGPRSVSVGSRVGFAPDPFIEKLNASLAQLQQEPGPKARSLAIARLVAQQRADSARTKNRRTRLGAISEDDETPGGFHFVQDASGCSASPIWYDTDPDLRGMEDSHVQIEDLTNNENGYGLDVDRCKKDDGRRPRGCTGNWNAAYRPLGIKRAPGDDSWWRHKERQNWQAIDFNRLF